MLNDLTGGQKFFLPLIVRVEAAGVSKAGTFYARGAAEDKSAVLKFICFEDQTAKFLKDNSGKPLAVSGILQPDSYSGGLQVRIDKAELVKDTALLANLPEPEHTVDIAAARKRFEEICRNVNRPGFQDFLKWLDTTDYFTAPASAAYHGAYDGGLIEHSLAVYDNLEKFRTVFTPVVSQESLIVAALFHDLCKTGFYIKQQRNVKKDGVWITVDGYAYEDKLPLGHGEKSVIMLMRYIQLTQEEMMAIRWHMGGWDESAQGYIGGKAVSAAFSEYPLAVLLHMADMADNYLGGKRPEK